MSGTAAFDDRVQRIEGLVRALDAAPDDPLRATALELVRAVMDLHGAGLERIVRIVRQAGVDGQAVMAGFTGDDLVASLLLLHSLHPLDLDARVAQALDRLQAHFRGSGAGVELVAVIAGTVRLRIHAGRGCAASPSSVRAAVNDAFRAAAPDAAAVEIEDAEDGGPVLGFVGLDDLRRSAEAGAASADATP